MSTSLIILDTHYNEIATNLKQWAYFMRYVSFDAIVWC